MCAKQQEIPVIIEDLAQQIITDNPALETVVLVGIVTRGYPLANRLAEKIKSLSGKEIPVGKLDITLYRDDLLTRDATLNIQETLMPETIENKTVILVDDVLFRGRTIRAALDNIMDYGRPKRIRLAILVDRGHREFPIAADYLGFKLKTSESANVRVQLKELDGKDSITTDG